tara:strand:- start:162 stop:686 length:525 start_codon:yes stop_codon:yes gene_type:complete
VIKRIVTISIIVVASFTINAQSDMSVLGNVIEAYFKTVSSDNLASRSQGLDTLMVDDAQMTSVLLQSNGNSSITTGSWKEYLENSAGFYNDFELKFSEMEREVDFYLDLASVHVLVEQRAIKKATKRLFTQNLWLQLELIFVNNRWHITDALWVNESNQLINNVLLQDTLMRVP